jgi:tetratricopeptide (TPR) repeat protein
MEKETASFWAGIKKFEDILARDPNAYSFAPLAEIYRKLDLPDEALRIARKGVALHPDFVAGQMVLATSCLDKGLTDEARQALEVVVRITPENLDAQRLLADLYLSAGNVAAADDCLRVVANLDPFLVEEQAEPAAEEPAAPASSPAPSQAVAVAAPVDTALHGEDEILDLTDDLIEEEVFEEEPFTPFAAAPERPSLLAREKGESMAFTTEAAAEPAPVTRAEVEEEIPQPPVQSATIAELYISQGLVNKGADVYRELLRENPGNDAYRQRYQELTGGGAEAPVFDDVQAPEGEGGEIEPVGGADPVAALEGWLGNIRRIRECRTEMR